MHLNLEDWDLHGQNSIHITKLGRLCVWFILMIRCYDMILIW